MTGTPVRIEGLNLVVGKQDLVSGLDLSLSAGERVGLTGHSGLGKSTLLRSIAANRLPAGSVAGTFDIQVPGSKIGYVPQNHGLLPWFTIRANVAALAKGELRRSDRDNQLITELAHQLDIYDHLDKLPSQLSGGQYQRAMLLVGLFDVAQLMLIDEPLTGVDLPTKLKILDAVHEILLTKRISALIISHDIDVLIGLTHRVFVLKQSFSDSHILQIEQQPKSGKVSDFLRHGDAHYIATKRKDILTKLG